MLDLEEEFQKLVQESIEKVREKYTKGEISHNDAADLIHLIEARTKPSPIHDPMEPEGGWEQSSWCGDQAWDSSEKCW